MNNVIQDIKDITDSREMMEARPHRFTSIFVYILLALFIAALIWSYFSETEIVVKADGMVRPEKEVSTVTNRAVGRVADVNIKEGQKVKAGDILYTVEHSDFDLQKSAYQKQIDEKNKEINNLQKLKECIEDNKNYFSDTDADEKDYYNKFIKYQSDCKDAENQVNTIQAQTQGQISTSQAQLQTVEDTLDKLNLLLQSVNDNKNYLPEGSSYYNQFQDYQMNINQYQSKINQAQNTYNSLKEQTGVSQSQLNAARNAIDDAKSDLSKYQSQFKTDLLSNIEQNESKKREFLTSINGNNQISNQTRNTETSSLDKYKMSTLTQIDDSIKADKDKLDELTADLKNVNINIDYCIVKAPIDGVVTINTRINKGDLLQGGTDIATIEPQDNSKYKIQLTVSNKDIGTIKEGQEVKYHFLALPYKEYGDLEGKITKIGTDAKQDQKSGTSFYVTEANIQNKPLYSHKGEKAEIKVGMICEVQVITRKEKVLYWLLEKINLKD